MARIGLQKDIKKADPKRYPFLFFYIGRIDWTRTSDLFDPNEAFYQAELQSDFSNVHYSYNVFFQVASVFLIFIVKFCKNMD